MVIYTSLLIAIIGLIIYLASTTGKPQEVGRIMFWVGLLAFLIVVVPRLVTVVK